MAKKKQKWGIGDIFLVPLEDGTFSVGQVVAQDKEALNSVVCIFTMVRVEGADADISIDLDDVVSALFTTPDLLNSGDWLVVRNEEPIPVDKFFDIKKLKSEGFLGVKVIGSEIVIKLMDACFGLYPWDGFYEPDYLDKLLLSPSNKPANVLYKN